jgi:hypothetical protein
MFDRSTPGFVIMEMATQAVLDQARRHRAEELAQRESAKSVTRSRRFSAQEAPTP